MVSLGLVAVLALFLYVFPLDAVGGPTGLELAFGGFGHEALVAICALMILGRGLVTTGALEPAARLMTRLWRHDQKLGLLTALLLGAGFSMFVNDTPVLVLMMPVLLNLSATLASPASKSLMPLNCAILIGGMTTTIGTSTNLLVVSIAADMGLPAFGVFQFADIALLAGVVALPYLWLVMPRLLPANDLDADHSPRVFDATLHVTEKSLIVGVPLGEAQSKLGANIGVLGAVRNEWAALKLDDALADGDALRVEGTIAALRSASTLAMAPLASTRARALLADGAAAADQEQVIAELAIGPDSGLIETSPRTARLAERYGVAVLGVFRPDRTILHGERHADHARLNAGDVLLVQGARSGLDRLQVNESALVLEGAAEAPRTARANIAFLIFAVVVAAAVLRVVPIAISALAGAVAMLATGCVKFDRIGRALSAEVIVLVAASIALGRTLMETGAASWVGGVIAFGLQSFPPAVIVAAMLSFAALLTNFSSNTAAAAVGTPIAVELGRSVGIAPEPLVLAVLFGCNLAYATPIAYQTNILIMSAGGYRFRDYVRAGLPLVVLMIATLTALLVWKYRL